MNLKSMKVEDLIPYENNARINDGAVEAVKNSIEECGYIAPIIIDENGVILAGHTRLKAIKEIGSETVDVLQMDGLSDEQKKKYRLLDNKTSEFSQWDFDKLREEVKDLDFGFDFNIDGVLEKGENIEAEKEKAKKVKPMSKFCTCPRCGKEFEE